MIGNRLGRALCGDLAAASRREWLVTNGLGGFASGTVADLNTRRYHGLLVAALNPPLGRTLLVAKLEATVHYGGRVYALGCNEYWDGTLHPHGYRYLESFHRDRLIPVWRYALGDALLERWVWMEYGANTTYVHYRLIRARAPLSLTLLPLCSHRNHHHHGCGGDHPTVIPQPQGCEIDFADAAPSYRVLSSNATFQPDGDWHWQFHHRREAERGEDALEDLYRPGRFQAELGVGETLTVVCTTESTVELDAEAARQREQLRQAELIVRAGYPDPPWIRQLVLAADQFLVQRDGEIPGTTVIAGYPWFSDWGRDTMISLPGLTLATGRRDEAAEILTSFARYRHQGLLPNRFSDDNQRPDYNTADATLWWFHAVYRYWQASADRATVTTLYPLLRDSLEWHQRGTLYGIGVDPEDGLLRAGEADTQLSWMDAKVDDWVVTPRHGKAVELNALWHHALRVMAELAPLVDDDPIEWTAAAERVAMSFQARFWSETHGYLLDVVDGPEGDDASLRPNQLFAVTLPFALLSPERAAAVVAVCQQRLLTSYGLRSLADDHDHYQPYYRGDRRSRDGAYHQGTVWSWLLGPLALAHYRIHGDREAARALLAPLADHLEDACLGSVSEIFDAEAPHLPVGAIAQAWGVAMTLEAWQQLS